jgi:hypothetical protein
MNIPKPSLAQWLAAAASVTGLAAITVVPLLQGHTQFDSKLAFDWMTFVAVVWATAFAADNLAEMQRTRVSEFEPLIDIEITERRIRTESRVVISVRNFGKGAAAGLRVILYYEDPDQVEWVPVEPEGLPEILKPGDTAEASVEISPVYFILRKEHPAHFLVSVTHRDPFGRIHNEERAYALVPDEDPVRFRRVGETVARQLGGKLVLLQQRLHKLAKEYELTSHGIKLVAGTHGDTITATIQDTQGDVWETRQPLGSPVFLMIESIEDRLRTPIRGVSVAKELPPGTSESESGPPGAAQSNQ